MLLELEFLLVEKCPACGSSGRKHLGNIGFGKIHYIGVSIPNPGIKVFECKTCGLVFKDRILGWEALCLLYREASVENLRRWSYDYDYSREFRLILDYAGGLQSLLDIGCNDCSFLREARAHFSTVSGIDVSRNIDCDEVINGEYLVIPFDQPLPEHLPLNSYDVVTLYDAIEHFVDIKTVISNCYRVLTPQGLLVLETGDYENQMAFRYGLSHWWYMNLLEHQVCFSKASMKRFLESNGFEVVFMENKIHKSNLNESLSRRFRNYFQRSIYALMGHRFYSRAFHLLGRRGQQPRKPGIDDQLFVIARKVQ